MDIIRLLRPLTVKDYAVFDCDLYPIRAMYVKKERRKIQVKITQDHQLAPAAWMSIVLLN